MPRSVFCLLFAVSLWGQSASEMTTRDEQASFRTKVNLVMVPVVVRNFRGDAVGNLTRENFQLFDKGRLQEIARFSVDKTAVSRAQDVSRPVGDATAEPSVVAPDRFVALTFDDIHLSLGDLTRVREAADRFIDQLLPTDRLAVYSMTGEINQDFTDDKGKLRIAIARVRPSLMTRMGALNSFEQRILISLQNIKAVTKRMNTLPGQRTMILISPGFFTTSPEYIDEKMGIIEQAIRSKVIISAIDARGLYTDPRFNVEFGRPRSLLQMQMAADIMAELASGTGGSFFENNNSFDEAFRRVAVAPEYLYLLGFSPQNLKSDGSFHSLRVSLKNAPGMTLTARHGYYAPKRTDDAAEVARQEIESALFSRDELAELPIELHTQFFKPNPQDAKVAALAHLGLQQFRFRKADGRNYNVVTLVTALFDRNGNVVQAIRKTVDLRLKDDTLAKLSHGVTVRTTFDVKPGTYLVRLVVRDAEGQSLSATNGAVQIE